ncbi:enhanced intracellular survival protein Eis [Paenibacillus yanchengensis]|uniref:Enhanced intracellular survival protein Eis n=1 Tax=Paenibacillus yanchengensis TaxID=2035833 RepID=A0ABW4YN75_9BACL
MSHDEAFVIKQFGLDYFEESVALLSFAFQGERSEEQRAEMRKKYDHPQYTRFGAFVDGELAAQVFIIHFETYIHGQVYKMGGISGVSTWPQYRRQGLVSKLLQQSIQFMQQQGQTVSYLFPFSESFYRKFGWELLCERKTYSFDILSMPSAKSVQGIFKRVSWDDKDLQQIYGQYALKYTGMLKRDELWWNERHIRNKTAQHVVYYEAEVPLAYMTYEVKEQVMNVHELIYVNEDAYMAFMSFIGQHDSMVEKVKLKTPADDILSFVMDNPRIETDLANYFMARIVDVEQFIKQYRFVATNQSDRIKLRVTDKQASWNNQVYYLDIDDTGKAQLHTVADDDEDGYEVTLSISILTAVLFGYGTLIQFARYNLVLGDAEQINRLHHRIPQQQTYISDFF